MKFAIITHVTHQLNNNQYYAYAPYVYEMNLWLKMVNQVKIVAPLSDDLPTDIDAVYQHSDIVFNPIPSFHFKDWKNSIKAIVVLPKIFYQIYKVMKASDHIHLRCPGNVGLLGAFVQILFPNKPKTAKYAGNWDAKSKQPWTYRLQKWILSNTFLTKNMQVLVYGNWPHQTKNIKPFFTATYHENEIIKTLPRVLSEPLQFIFVGTLTPNKRPLLCVEVIHQLKQKGYSIQLSLYGEGSERSLLENYICDNHLQNEVILKGNVTKEMLKKAYQKSHFLLFFSKSEGWPKAVAEAMFWGCVPITTSVSCVPEMIGNGSRGTMVKADASAIISAIENYLSKPESYKKHSQNAMEWSQQYTLERFELEIEKLVSNFQYQSAVFVNGNKK
ncbi:MAG: glycosyltransferase [Flavobacteriaceae bacterium]|nr:glycosyltransferase [Flavobacteriaceae bacterium]